jgi:2-phosphosulfolactate phosphatase
VTDDPDARTGSQGAYAVRLDWGAVGGSVVAAGCDIAVVVDVLSFTTTLSVAADRGTQVIPCSWNDERAVALARRHDAHLAVGRAAAAPGRVSLSPGSVRAVGSLPRLVLPSPNGSTISTLLAGQGVMVVGASLRNRRAVARWLQRSDAGRQRIAVIPAGERWPDGSLRPAIEDLWGAGAVLSALTQDGRTGLSPEAHVAAAAFDLVADDVGRALHGCASGVELDGLGFPDDVDVAAELDRSDAVPVLVDGAFVPGQR